MQTVRMAVCTEKALGPVRIMNAVNNGPMKGGDTQTRSNFDDYAALEIPYARIHDAALCTTYGGCHTVDITCIFPDFRRDPDDAAAYDFTLTDGYLATMHAAGTEPFYRLGQSIEHWVKKYGVNPPADFGKWASICEHIVRHYNEGWADGFHWGIQYWEIWNEPDLGPRSDGRPSPTWTGTKEQFFELYRLTATRLKQAFPALKIGGPALASPCSWTEEFLAFLRETKTPLDFFSWHRYTVEPSKLASLAVWVKERLVQYGFTQTESILNEWNYVRGWHDEWVYSLRVESGDLNYKGAAFIAAVMCACQQSPLDMLMFYDARVSCAMNNLFDHVTLEPLRGYYPFYAWAKLRRLGTAVAVQAENGTDLYTTAAIGADGRMGLLLARYNNDDNVTAPEAVALALPAGRRPVCHLTDATRLYTETPLVRNDAGEWMLTLKPNAFAYIEMA